ncbi:MAG: phosphatase PAP2 family protein [Planctomycetes bacterium]|nr:phosphatase PAP2 family protein [Planctomycetota bacterium]
MTGTRRVGALLVALVSGCAANDVDAFAVHGRAGFRRIEPPQSQAEPAARPPRQEPGWIERTWGTVLADHGAFYDQGTMLGLGAGIGLAALSANSQLDRDIYDDALAGWRTHELGEARNDVQDLGDGAYVLPVLATASLFGPALGSPAIGEWGERSLRGVLVGAPPMLALQRLIGAGRPDDPANTTSSEWQPFEHSNGVSGHAFIGSVPLLTVARMQDDPAIDVACYLGSMVVAAARLQGSKHYFSQVALGWWIGYLATGAVDDAERGIPVGDDVSVLPILGADEVGFVVVHRL